MQSLSAASGEGLPRLLLAGAVLASVLVAAFLVSGTSSGNTGTSLTHGNGAGAIAPGPTSGANSTTLTSQTLLVSTQAGPAGIAGKVTIVLCPEPAVVNASFCQVPADMYSARQLVLTPSSGAPVAIPLNPDGTFTAQVPSGSYQVSISNCNFLGCDRPYPSSISVVTSMTVTVCFNCSPT
jgi:hypothetical protein